MATLPRSAAQRRGVGTGGGRAAAIDLLSISVSMRLTKKLATLATRATSPPAGGERFQPGDDAPRPPPR